MELDVNSILIVDDEENIRHMLSMVLGRAGFECDTAADGVEGLAKLRERPFEIVLCDINMPRMTGMELLPQLEKEGIESTVIMITAFGSVDMKITKLPGEALREIEFSDELSILCLTHAHVHDEEIVEYCLDKPFRYLGLISSRKKWALFRERYGAKGFTEEQLSRVSTPVGLDIGADTPLEIAIAIAAEMILLRARPKDYAAGFGRFKR